MSGELASARVMQPLKLETALGRYAHTAALRDGRVRSHILTLDFADLANVNRAFAPMVREQRFHVCEIAIATFLQAKAYDKPLVLLPVVTFARFQESAMLCRTDGPVRGPADLAGRRVGVRAYSQTTGLWLRGVLAERYGIRPEQMRWITFEGAHVAEYEDPPWAERAAAGKNLLGMLRAGELDAVIVGADVPDDSALKPVFDNPVGAADAFWRDHRFVPVNHLVAVRRDAVERRPEAVADLMRMFREARDLTPSLSAGKGEMHLQGRAALDPAVALALRYAGEQKLLPRRMNLDDVWEGLPAGY